MKQSETNEWIKTIKALKPQQCDKVAEVTSHFTSDTHIKITVDLYFKGMYITIKGTRRNLSVWCDWSYEVSRKPKDTGFKYETLKGKGFL